MRHMTAYFMSFKNELIRDIVRGKEKRHRRKIPYVQKIINTYVPKMMILDLLGKDATM